MLGLRALAGRRPEELATIADAHEPDGAFMAQVARELTDTLDGLMRGKRHFVIDRDTKFTEAFRKTLARASVEAVLTAVRAPHKNAIAVQHG